eukprot:591712-Prorocentrum_minimum.AAC.1
MHQRSQHELRSNVTSSRKSHHERRTTISKQKSIRLLMDAMDASMASMNECIWKWNPKYRIIDTSTHRHRQRSLRIRLPIRETIKILLSFTYAKSG